MSVLITFSDIQSQVRSDLNVSSSSSQYPTGTVDRAINRAYIKISRLFKWTQLADAKETNTQANIENYDFPEGWSPNSAWKLEVDDDEYGEEPDNSPLRFEDYLIWKTNNSNSTDKKWSVFGNQYFIYPTPSSAGSYNISIWGQKAVTELSSDDDETIFSNNMTECNEALALEALAILKKKGEAENVGQMRSKEALVILTNAFEKVKRNLAKYEKKLPFFFVPDYYQGRNTSRNQITGNFR